MRTRDFNSDATISKNH